MKFMVDDRVVVIGNFRNGEKGIVTGITPPPSTLSVEINGVGYGFLESELKFDKAEMVKLYGAEFKLITGAREIVRRQRGESK